MAMTPQQTVLALREIKDIASPQEKVIALRKLKAGEYAAEADVFAPVKSEVTPETAEKLAKEQSNFSKNVERLQRSSGWDYETLMERGAIGQHQIDTPTKRLAELESRGVVTNRDLPAGDWKLGFGIDKMDSIKAVLSDHFGKPVKVMKDKDDIIYYDPEEKKVVKANLGAIASGGYALPIAGDIGATAATMHPALKATSLPGKIGSESLASAIGTGFGEFVRLAIGKATGVHDADIKEMMAIAGKEGGVNAALTGATGAVISTAKGAYNFIKGGVHTVEEAKKYGLGSKDANEIIEATNKILKEGGSDKAVKATVAQRSDDLKLASMEAELKTSQEHGQRFANRAKSDQAATTEALDVISQKEISEEMLPNSLKEQAGMPDSMISPDDRIPAMLQEQAGIPDSMVNAGAKELDNVHDIAKSQVRQRQAKVTRIIAKNEKELESQLSEIGKIQKENVGAPTADYLALKYETEKQAANKSWDSVKSLGKFNSEKEIYNIEIPHGDATKRLKKIYDARYKSSQTQASARRTGGAYVAEPKKQTQDLHQLNEEISDVREELALARLGKSKSASSVRELDNIKNALVDDRRLALIKMGRKDILEGIEAAERQTTAFHDKYTRSVVADLMEKTPNGVPAIKSQNFVDDMLGRDAAEFDALADVIGDNMELVSQWREGLADAYKRASFDEVTGKFNRGASERWFTKYGKSLTDSGFFTGAELNKVRKAGTFSEKAYEASKELQKFVNKAESKWGSGVLSKVDPDGLTKFITGSGGAWSSPQGVGIGERINKIKFVKNMTAKHPAAWNRIQNDFKQQIRDNLIDPATGRIKPSAIAEWADGGENARVVEEVLGSKYLADLRTINDAVKIINKSETRLVGSQTVKGTVQAIRAGIAPPLTARGRVLSAALIFRTKADYARAADSFLDEAAMRKTAELLRHNPASRVFAEKAATLGYAIQDNNEEPGNE